jgi:transposase
VEQAHAKSDWSTLRRIAVDETSARRGHRYVSNILDAENSRLLLMVEGRSAEALRAFAEALLEHGADPSQIQAIYANSDPQIAETELTWWVGWAARSRLSAFRDLAKTVRQHWDGPLFGHR